MMKNLDLACANLGRQLAEIQSGKERADETVFSRALGVLEEQGLYACFLYLKMREGSVGQKLAQKAAKFLGKSLDVNENDHEPLQFAETLASDLNQLLFARDLLRQAFVYARYHAKANGEGRGGET